MSRAHAHAKAPAPRPDHRLGETWTPAQRRKNDAIYRLATAATSLFALAPRACAAPLGRLLGTLVWAAWARGRRDITRGLRAAAITDVGAHDVLRGLGVNLVDTVRLLGPAPAREAGWTFDETSRASLASAVAAGRGVVFATAHLGAWERMASGLVEEGFPITTIARESYDPRFHRLYERLREARGVQVLYRGAPGFGTALVRSLRSGRIVGFPMDIAGRGVRTVAVPFFGAPRALPIGPATLVKRTGAALVVGTPTRSSEAGVSVRIARIAPESADSAAALTATLAAALEARIRALPCEWPWLLVAEAAAAPLESGSSKDFLCAKRSTPPSPASTPRATSARCP